MKAFISYSHADSQWLDILHKHLTHLQRDHLISSWTDELIKAGDKINQKIFAALEGSDLFIALLSPDYIASNYCYEKEFQKAMALQEEGKLTVIPVIIEPCDWLNTPFKEFKALPKDGKAVSTWENKNTAFLDVIQNIRKLVSALKENVPLTSQSLAMTGSFTRNYRVQKDFDSIEKMEFVEKSFHEIKEFLKRYMEELVLIDDNIKVRILNDLVKDFECLLVNRNKINAEAKLNISTNMKNSSGIHFLRSDEMHIGYSISNNNRPSEKDFKLTFDQYHLMWAENDFYSNSRAVKEFSSKDIAEQIWNEWLQSVGII